MTALRMNEGKPKMDFILDFPKAVESLCRVMEIGAIKYDVDNWKKGGKPDSEYYAACMRHLFEARSGVVFADDTGCLHLAHAVWNILALIELNYGITHHLEMFEESKEAWQWERVVPDENRHPFVELTPLKNSEKSERVRKEE